MAFVAAGTLANTEAATAAVNIPSHTNGDILALGVAITQGGTSPAATIDTPGGALTWTQRTQAEAGNASAVGLASFTAVGDGSQTSVTVSVTGGSGNPRYTAQVLAFDGRDGSVETTTSTTQESGVDINSPSITPTVDGADIFRGYVFDDDISTAADHDSDAGFLGTSSGYGEGSTPGNGHAAAYSYQEDVPNSATGTSTWSSNGDDDAGVAFTIALLPVVGGNFDQDSFRGRNDDGSESAATWKAAANTNWNQRMDENFRVRFLIEELDDVEDLDVQFQLQYRVNAGSWTDVNGSSSNARSSASPNVTDGADTTEQMSGPGTFITNNDGFDEVNGLAGGTVLDFTTTVNQEVELEYSLQLRSADLTKGDTVDLRVVKEADVLLNSYTNTPTLTPIFGNIEQTKFRARNDDGSESAATWKTPENTDWTQTLDANFRIRFLLTEINDWVENNLSCQLQYNLNSAGWNNVDASSSVARSSASANLTDGADTTQQLGSGTFITNNDGVDEVDGLAGGANLDFTGDDEAEIEYCLQLRSADLVEGDTVEFRISGLDTYSQTPTVTPKFPTHFVMSLSSNFAEGDPTSGQLTSQSGLYQDGTIEEDTGIADTPIELEGQGYTEFEFCVQAHANSIAGEHYEFRLVDETQSGEKLETYSVTPRVTVEP